jgi:nucleoid DNA-binding protein
MAKLTKRDIVVAISNQTGMVQHQVFDIVQRTLDKITDSLANNVPVELRNFGIFQPRLTKPRVGRNPNQPGSSFVIPSRALLTSVSIPNPLSAIPSKPLLSRNSLINS